MSQLCRNPCQSYTCSGVHHPQCYRRRHRAVQTQLVRYLRLRHEARSCTCAIRAVRRVVPRVSPSARARCWPTPRPTQWRMQSARRVECYSLRQCRSIRALARHGPRFSRVRHSACRHARACVSPLATFSPPLQRRTCAAPLRSGRPLEDLPPRSRISRWSPSEASA